ncbi:MAG: TRAP transporter permease [Oscillospiraceae bacterium]|nr:TRAP transporter permease [Oscillospiraceae bacterium]MDY5736444.1 TRAP transporter permease [Oscillospiraceae bacterium]
MAENENINQTPVVDADVGTAADVEAIMKKYDRESNTRYWEGVPKTVLRWFTALFGIYLIVANMFLKMDERARRPIFLGIVILLVFAYYPLKKGSTKVNHIPWYDVVLALVGSFCYFFYPMNLEKIVNAGTRINKNFVVGGVPLLIVFAIVGTLILVECCRRVVGIPIICVSGVFVLYAFLGAGKDLKTVMYNLFYTTTGILGTPIGVCSTYIALFVIFGAFLEATGVANFFIDCANALVGWASGGPAKVAVVSSALCGMVSGSSVGNTVTTGSVTIPMMKKTGYPPEFAGAVEAASSTGGQIMPPIMGAAAFLMAEMVGVPYKDIIVRAILPAFLYFLGIFLEVHFKAKKLGLKGLPRETLPKWKKLLPEIYLLLPLVVLVYMIMVGFTMATAAVYATIYCIVASMVSREEGKKKLVMAIPFIPLLIMTFTSRSFEAGTFMGDNGALLLVGIAFVIVVVNFFISKINRKSLPTVIDAFENGGKNCLSVGVACGMAGIIAGVVTMTGLGQILIGAIVRLANGHLIVALVLTMLCCIVLGMGVPTTANYIIMATTCAPILATGMGMNLMAAHMFCFYFGIVADITPPVALAAYAGSAIAKAPPMKTAVNATKLAIAAFLVPYIFAFNNAMLFINTKPLDVISVVISSTLGMLLIAIGMVGYFLRDTNMLVRLGCVAGGLLLVYPGTVTDLIGLAVLVAVFLLQKAENARDKKAVS